MGHSFQTLKTTRFESFAETVDLDKTSLLKDFEAALPYIDLLKKKKGGLGGLSLGPVCSLLKLSIL